MTECQHEGCNNQAHSGGFCTVHITSKAGQRRSFTIDDFEIDLLGIIFRQIILDSKRFQGFVDRDIKDSDFNEFLEFVFCGGEESLRSKYGYIFNSLLIDLNDVLFSADDNDLFVCAYSHLKKFDFVRISGCVFVGLELCLFSEFKYVDCNFLCCDLVFNEYSEFFESCRFERGTRIFLTQEVGDKELCELDFSRIFHRNCKFYGDLVVAPAEERRFIGSISGFFPNQSLYEKVSLHDLCFSESFLAQDLFSSVDEYNSVGLEFFDCVFKGRFVIDGECYFGQELKVYPKRHGLHSICKIKMEDVSFKDKFEMKRVFVPSVDLVNVSFEKVADFNGSKFLSFKGVRIDSNEFFAFENVYVLEDVSVFEYATFQGHATFRSAKFFGGLDLDRANFSDEANFLGVDADGGDVSKTTRETYRLIKHSFDKIGNHLEANKFFAKEMDKYREEVAGNKSLPWWDLAVYHVNKSVSDFGQNYMRSICWLFVAAIAFYVLTLGHKANWLYKIWPAANPAIEWVSTHLNGFANAFMPFKQFLIPGMEFLSLIFYVIFAALIWQTVVALKRHTRR